jgi:hypothetical protein
LPDGFFSDQKSRFGDILEDLGMENVDIYSGHLEFFTRIGYIQWPFGIFVVIWYIPPPLVARKKSGNPGEVPGEGKKKTMMHNLCLH